MRRRTRIGVAAAIGILALVLAGIGTAYAVGAGDADTRGVSGATADRARAAAVQAVRAGRAGAVDRESDEGATAYTLRVTRPDGSTVWVRLDAAYTVLGVASGGQEAMTADRAERPASASDIVRPVRVGRCVPHPRACSAIQVTPTCRMDPASTPTFVRSER